MSPVAAFALGALAAFVVAGYLMAPGDCCDRVSAAVRDRVVGAVGPIGGTAYDALGLGKYAPGVLNLFGVS